MPSKSGQGRRAATAVQVVLGGAGLLLLAAAWSMDQGWADRHFLPAWAYAWETQLRILFWLRVAVALVGALVLLLLRPWAARAVAAGRGRAALVSVLTAGAAVALAFVAVEFILHARTWRS